MTAKEMYCNLCGKRFSFWDEQEKYSIHTTCGYGSENDGATIELDLCCDCMDALVKKCIINPIIAELDSDIVEGVF